MSSPRIPKSEIYWKNKGKKPMINSKNIETYKNVMLYFHDDCDGIYSSIIIKKYLIKQGFNIIGYGIMNYQEGWKYTTLHPELINVCVDFSMHHKLLDVYCDHHYGDLPSNKIYAIKTNTGSAFEGISLQYGIPNDSLTLHPIDMIDSAKYKHYGVNICDVINFDWKIIKKSNQSKLTYVGMMNQFIKRSDHTTLIEVVHNCHEPSIYAIVNKLKEFYSGNNLWKDGLRKDFILDGKWRINTMKERTRGFYTKKVYMTQQDFINDFYQNGKIDLYKRGYQIIGNLAFIPTGSWANGIRARAILQEDMDKGIIPKDCVDFIMLQYGNTLQVVAYNSIESLKSENRLPILKNNILMDNIGLYMTNLLNHFIQYLGYVDISTYVFTIEDEITVSGGHKNIGTMSNIVTTVKGGEYSKNYIGMKYLNLFINKIISDLSTCEWNSLNLVWSAINDNDIKEIEMNHRVMMIDSIRKSGKEKSIKER